MTAAKRTRLNFLDIVILSVIFFGIAIWQSLSAYFMPQTGAVSASAGMETITDQMQWISIIQEIVLLGLAALYLRLRKFDFKVLNFKFTKWTLPLCIGLIIAGAGISDLGMGITDALLPSPELSAEETATLAPELSAEETAGSALPEFGVMMVLFALLNGFFEEVFFLGLVFAADRKSLPWALLFSVLVRFSFHIYQGIPAAVGITCMGLLFMLARKWIKSLTPFTLAHSFFDVFGVTLWFWISMLLQ